MKSILPFNHHNINIFKTSIFLCIKGNILFEIHHGWSCQGLLCLSRSSDRKSFNNISIISKQNKTNFAQAQFRIEFLLGQVSIVSVWLLCFLLSRLALHRKGDFLNCPSILMLRYFSR